jgi:hypothetical protein
LAIDDYGTYSWNIAVLDGLKGTRDGCAKWFLNENNIRRSPHLQYTAFGLQDAGCVAGCGGDAVLCL